MSLEIFQEKVALGLFASASTKIQVQDQTSSPAGRLVGKKPIRILNSSDKC